MFNLGQIQRLQVARVTPIGVYLTKTSTLSFSNESGDRDDALYSKSFDRASNEVLLPNNEFKLGPNARKLDKDDLVDAFIYLDSEDRPVATLKTPALTLGGLALLKVKDVTKIGAFLDWGLLKDLFLPFKQQTGKVNPGDDVLVTLYLDKSNRLCASMKVYKLLRSDSEYKAGDQVNGLVYELSDNFGAFVAVDNIFSGLIPKKELMRDVRVGEKLSLRIMRVLEDGKLELSAREPGYLQINADCERVLAELKASKHGFLPYHDKSDSLVIKTKFNMSKNSFKRAIGHLYKDGLLTIKEDGIYLKEDKPPLKRKATE